MLTEIEMLLQKQTLKIHSEFQQLLAELASYRLENGTLTQDSVMALGFAVTNADSAHAVGSAGRESVLDLEPFTSDWYDWYENRRLRSYIDILNDNDARRGIMPPGERRARARAPQSSSVNSLATS
jgi:hypothetical protein